MNSEKNLIEINNRYEISQYEELCSLDEKGRVRLVRHRETREIRVKKTLNLYNERILKKLKNAKLKGFPKIFFLADGGGELVVIEEYIHGRTLDEIYQESGCINKLLAVEYMIKVCEIISALHKEVPQLIHCDIKPSNIMLTADNIIKIIDVNTVREVPESNKSNCQYYSFGTPKYAAPEQFKTEGFDEKVDVYGIGKTLESIIREGITEYSTEEEYRKIAEIIARCTEEEADNRYNSVIELKKKLLFLKVRYKADENDLQNL